MDRLISFPVLDASDGMVVVLSKLTVADAAANERLQAIFGVFLVKNGLKGKGQCCLQLLMMMMINWWNGFVEAAHDNKWNGQRDSRKWRKKKGKTKN